MAVTPRIHDVAEQEALAIEERYPGYRAALVKALDDVVGHQSQSHTSKRRDDITNVVDALGRSAVVAGAGGS
jgi:antitoxin component of RelBE/YafQ-DinJ toxin-antitoxin module